MSGRGPRRRHRCYGCCRRHAIRNKADGLYCARCLEEWRRKRAAHLRRREAANAAIARNLARFG